VKTDSTPNKKSERVWRPDSERSAAPGRAVDDAGEVKPGSAGDPVLLAKGVRKS
jgi:hypothetical protein